MVTAIAARLLLALLLICPVVTAVAEVTAPVPGIPYYYDEFDPDLKPWRPAGERNLEEVKRIPMRKPSGKYNVYNKIHRSPGTSH